MAHCSHVTMRVAGCRIVEYPAFTATSSDISSCKDAVLGKIRHMQKVPRGSVAACELLNTRIVYLAVTLTACAVLVWFVAVILGEFGAGRSWISQLLPAVGLTPAVYMATFICIHSLYQCVTRLMGRAAHSASQMNEDYGPLYQYL